MELKSDIAQVKGVGIKTAEYFYAMGIKTIADLFEYFPRKYDDYSNVTSIKNLMPGLVCIRCNIGGLKTRRVRRGLHITEAIATDTSASVKITWFNQPYRAASIDTGKHYLLSGEFGLKAGRLQIVNPSLEQVDDAATESKPLITLVPTYKESAKLNSKFITKIIKKYQYLFNDIPESLPSWILDKYVLLSRQEAYLNLHIPSTRQMLDRAMTRMAFEELLIVMLAAKKNRDIAHLNKAPIIKFDEDVAKEFVKSLPYKLTDSQRKAVWQIYKDIQKPLAMNRLIDGDVGSGKTVVATMAALMVMNSNKQVAFIAPTELLARQHAKTADALLRSTKHKSQYGLLLGSTSAKDKKAIKQKLASGKIKLLIGTHALLQKTVIWDNLSLIIIDEQHRFGVEQRQKLLHNSKTMPHVLLLTATPIPRSLALTVYGELDISILDQAPTTRAGVDTELVSPNSLAQMYESINKQLSCGRQAYVVCPIITESETLQVADAEQTYQKLKATYLKKWRIGLLHGKLKPSEKEAIMRDFVEHKYDVLVSTTVIEVGVDVHNASVMVILAADRFGLAQLHQLRGRVGRGEHRGYCYLVLSDSLSPSRRMKAIAQTDNGFELSELDLDIRGPGAIYGYRQHGTLDFRFAKLSDAKMIAQVRDCIKIAENQSKDMLKYNQIAEKVRRVSRITYLN